MNGSSRATRRKEAGDVARPDNKERNTEGYNNRDL